MNKLLPIIILLSLSSIRMNAQEVTQSIRFTSSLGKAGFPISNETLKKNDKGEYFILTAISAGDFYIDQDTFFFEPLPNSDEDDVSFLLKLSQNLELERVVTLRGVRFAGTDLSISQNRVFIGESSSKDVKYIDNQLLEVEEGKRGLIHEFDHELNYLGTPLIINQRIEHIAAFSDSTLYINARLKNIDTMVFETDTLFNFVTSNGHSEWESNAVINYNYKNQEVEHLWKYGSLVYDTSVGLEVDSDGDLYVASTFGWWIFSIDGETEIDNLAGETDCIIKFSPQGDVIWSTYDPWHNPTEIKKIFVLENKEVLALYHFSASQHISITGDTIYAQTDSISTSRINLAVVKYDSLGQLTWLYNVDGYNLDNHTVNDVSVFGDTLEILNIISRCDSLNLGNNVYTDIYLDQAFIYLDIHSGEELDGYLIEDEDDEADVVPKSIRCHYVERFDESTMIRTAYTLNLQTFDLFGESWGTDGRREQYFIELDGELFSQVNNPPKDKIFSLYPNPIIRNSELNIEFDESIIGQLTLYTAKGKQLQMLSLSQVSLQGNRLDLKGLAAGAYFVQLQLKSTSQTEIFIIQ